MCFPRGAQMQTVPAAPLATEQMFAFREECGFLLQDSGTYSMQNLKYKNMQSL